MAIIRSGFVQPLNTRAAQIFCLLGAANQNKAALKGEGWEVQAEDELKGCS